MKVLPDIKMLFADIKEISSKLNIKHIIQEKDRFHQLSRNVDQIRINR